MDRCPHGYELGMVCPSGFCGDGSGTGIVVETDLMSTTMAQREANKSLGDYTPVIAGNALGTHTMCRRCGALIAPEPAHNPDGLPTPQSVHSGFHSQVNEMLVSLVRLLNQID